MSVNVYQFVTENSTAYQPMTIPNFFLRHIYIYIYIYIYQFTNLILFVSPKNIDSTGPLDDDNLVISAGYNLIHSDHASNTKCGGVCLYYKIIYL